MAARVCLVHYHEVGLKGKNRAHFEHILMDNIKAALAAFSVNAVSRISGYILVTFNEHQADEAARVIRTVPGVARVSLAYHTNRDPQEYCAAAVKALREFGSFDSFKVHAKRSNTDYELTSIDINRQVGEVLCEAFPDKKVQMHDPDAMVHVLVVQGSVYVYARSERGVGGLPVGSAGKVVTLLSSGIDSPVATWMLARRGAVCVPVHFSGRPQTPDTSEYLVQDIIRALEPGVQIGRLYVVPFGDCQREISVTCPSNLRVIMYRRIMYSVAERIARIEGAKAIVTGESLGQVASQTLENIMAVNEAVKIPVFRPLIGSDKQEIIARAEEMGLLGTNILGSNFNFHIHVNKGAGAFVCGEGSALTASIEGNRGMPRVKPPRTIEHGLWAEPTVLNNVETFANVPLIIKNGVEWYHSIGTEKSPGTKAFALTGNVVNTGLIEVPMGTTIREVVFDIGGGIPDGKKFKAVQIGGPSGGATTASDEHLDLPLDFDSLKSIGAMIGSGGLVVMDEDTCMVETARFFMRFTQNESCGKCVPCREGTKRMLEILDRIIANEGSLEDLDLLQELSKTISETALCGLGQSACKPVQSTLRHFRQDYLRHVVDHHCPICNGRKRRLVIKPELCKGCGKCKRNCPMEAISGEIRMPHTIDNDKCIHCGACWGACPFGAIDAIEEEG